jgi:hypothetical protein
MTLNLDKKAGFDRFVSCVCAERLLIILKQVAIRAIDGDGHSVFAAGATFTDDFKLTSLGKINLTCREIFRGKISRRQTQTNKTRLEKTALPAPILP